MMAVQVVLVLAAASVVAAAASVVEPSVPSRVSLNAAIDAAPFVQGAVCDDCKSTLAALQAYLDDEGNRHKIADQLKAVCKKAHKLEALCDEAVELVVPAALSWFVDQSTKSLCEMIKLCKPQPAAVVSEQQHQLGNDKCELCEQIIQVAQAELVDPDVQEQLTEQAVKLCDKVPHQRDVCVVAVKAIAPYAIQALINADRVKICTAIKLCKKMDPSASSECQMCTMVVDTMKQYITPDLIASIVQQIDAACSDFLPDVSEQAMCKAVAETALKQGVAWLHDVDTAKLCQAFCSA